MKLLKVMGDISTQGTTADPGDVFKTPWNYYGKPVKFTVTVAIVQDYPPDSDTGKMGMLAEVVGATDDATIVDIASMVSSGKVNKGDRITITGYAVGHVSVQNKLGGKTDQLFVVTNKLK